MMHLYKQMPHLSESQATRLSLCIRALNQNADQVKQL